MMRSQTETKPFPATLPLALAASLIRGIKQSLGRGSGGRRKKTYPYSLAVLLLALAAPLNCAAQLVGSLDRRSGGGVVTTMEEGTVSEGDYAAKGILSDWKELLEEYTRLEDEGALDTVAFKPANLQADSQAADFGFPMVPLRDRLGREFLVPSMIGEDGYDCFLLTEEGIAIYLFADGPVYVQEVDREIIRWIRFYAYHKRGYTKVLFRRYKDWEQRIKLCFRHYGVPEEIAELCLIESGCTYEALSPVGALGMWQIMPATGRQFGLRVDMFKDERTDPVLATDAAARILAANYRKTGDWTTAVAAYNCGSGWFTGKRAGLPWASVREQLPKETQNYIPSLIAIHYVWTYRERLGF